MLSLQGPSLVTENGNNTANDSGVPTAFRMPKRRRLQLELISKERGHSHMSVTLNEAVDEYIDGYLRGRAA